jgi:hypothetical protein
VSKNIVPPHFSYSSLSSYMQCGKRYFLEKIAHVPELPSWWFVGGSAVHELTELYDRSPEKFQESGLDQLWSDIFNREVEAQKTRFTDVSKWQTAGKKKANPDGEDYLAWMDLGPKFVQNYIDWRTSSPMELWQDAVSGFDPSTGEVEYSPGIELALEFEIADWKARGSIDRVFYSADGQDLVVIDLKTGSRMPDSDLQLGLYAVGMEVQYGERPKYGAFYNLRQNRISQMYDLDDYTVDSIGQLGVQFKRAVENKIFLPHKSALCNYCPVNAGCAAFGGEDAHLYTIEKVLNG